ncbi:AbrB/MazE/SpoVT family DNA-binding domain-containing protein (plasmid) [Candidatus Trichorickettsia mobilis]|jgi:antitoxin VapB|uniref:type II toxin-antitoxin system VapB family antitoxin n=1 Tax=Candidatus Trichorickettsia mobilis TaxID=1346319 RepID=UPI002B2644A9|nr:type II toxin-antitoxin system VapB family antitoxin [Candidatus Trichorickettsia mobilis]WPY01896.1 AbrB/MazE/SpoVT family DNA-binding domain-containing protein [Candidatus Trichorickettsia mobilis]
MHKAKIFKNGQSQAVRLPKEFRFTTNEVSVTPLGNGIVIQPLLKTWKDVFNEIKPTDDFFAEDRKDLSLQERKWELFK